MLTGFAADLGRYREIRRHVQLRNSGAAVNSMRLAHVLARPCSTENGSSDEALLRLDAHSQSSD